MLGLLMSGGLATLLWAGPLEAQDFWLMPDSFTTGSRSTVTVAGMSGNRFPQSGYSLRPAAVADARLIGAAGQERVVDLSSDKRDLRLRRKPRASGQYIVAVSLKSHSARMTKSAFLRHLREQGAEEEAARLSRESAFGPTESVTIRSQRFATVIVDVGSGPKVFDRGAGYPIDFIPQSDPARVTAGDTLGFRVVLDGHPLSALSIHVTVQPEARPNRRGDRSASTDVRFRTDVEGMVRIPATESGAWKLSAVRVVLLASPGGSGPGFWDVTWATYVFHVGRPRGK
jgi:uncharacterized GH25 family protein